MLISAPLMVLRRILENIRGFVDDIFGPSVSRSQFTIATTGTSTDASRQYSQRASDVMQRLALVLEYPFGTLPVVTLVQNKYSVSDVRKGDDQDQDELDCEMANLICNSNALFDVLLF